MAGPAAAAAAAACSVAAAHRLLPWLIAAPHTRPPQAPQGVQPAVPELLLPQQALPVQPAGGGGLQQEPVQGLGPAASEVVASCPQNSFYAGEETRGGGAVTQLALMCHDGVTCKGAAGSELAQRWAAAGEPHPRCELCSCKAGITSTYFNQCREFLHGSHAAGGFQRHRHAGRVLRAVQVGSERGSLGLHFCPLA